MQDLAGETTQAVIKPAESPRCGLPRPWTRSSQKDEGSVQVLAILRIEHTPVLRHRQHSGSPGPLQLPEHVKMWKFLV
jgi:hypothetical protein